MAQDHGQLIAHDFRTADQDEPVFLTESEAAKLLRMSAGKLAEHRRAGEIGHYKPGRSPLYTHAHIDAFLKSKEIAPCRAYDEPDSGSNGSPVRPTSTSAGMTPFRSEHDVRAVAQRIRQRLK